MRWAQLFITQGQARCGACKTGYYGNQTVGCLLASHDICPDGITKCDRHADCTIISFNQHSCRVRHQLLTWLISPSKIWADFAIVFNKRILTYLSCLTLQHYLTSRQGFLTLHELTLLTAWMQKRRVLYLSGKDTKFWFSI